MVVPVRSDSSPRLELPEARDVLPLEPTVSAEVSASLSNAITSAREAAGRLSAVVTQQLSGLTESVLEAAEPVRSSAGRRARTVVNVVFRDIPEMFQERMSQAAEAITALPERLREAATSALEVQPRPPTSPSEHIDSNNPYFGDQ